MLGMVKMAPADWRYYASQVAVGLEDYYTGAGEAPGQWSGRGAAGLGLAGEVDPVALAALFGQGRHPLSEEPLGVAWNHRRATGLVAGYSLSLSPPKSVSVLWALGGSTVAAQVRQAHDTAVASAVSFLEDHAAFSRMGKAGVFQVDTHGLVIASFVHRTSRAIEPQLHTHLLVSNKARCGDGRWRALDGRELYAHQKPAGNLYQAALRAELTARLGVAWEAVDTNGQADIVGVPTELCRHFSSRRRDIEVAGAIRVASAEARLGRSLTSQERAEAFQVATLATRAAKEAEALATKSLVERWSAQAAGFGWSAEHWLDDTLDRPVGQLELELEPFGDLHIELVHGELVGGLIGDVVTEVVAELAEQRSTWGRADAVRGVARRLPPALVATAEAARAWIEAGADAVVADRQVVALAAPARAEIPAGLCRSDGLPTTKRHGAGRYTTRATLALEAEVVDFAGRGREAAVAVASATAIAGAVADAGLGTDQAVAIARVCGAGEALVCLVGPAGAGKTRSVGAARLAWESSGIAVRGLAVSAVAAGVLSEEAGLTSDTVAKFLVENAKIDPEAKWRLQRGEVVVVDEASMVASADLAALVGYVEAAEAKLVLVGDHRQLGAVGAGGLFRLLVADTNAAELTDARRFVEPWEAAATLRLRRGDVSVVHEYERHGRLAGGSREDMVDAAFATWQRCRERGESVVVLAHDHLTVDALALRARAVRVAAGEVEPGGVAVGHQVAGVGDEVVTTANDRRLVTSRGAWVRNGDRWVVTERRHHGSLVVEHADGRGRVVLPGDYVAERVALSYAVTVHKAQGLTVDRGVVVVDEGASAELIYVAMTRGRLENQACLVLETGDGHGWRRPPTPPEALADVLGRSGAERSATEVLRSELARSEDLAELVPALIEAQRFIDQRAGPDRRDELDELRNQMMSADRAVSAAAERVRQAEQRLERAQAGVEAGRAEVEALRSQGPVRRRLHAEALRQAQHVLRADLDRLAGAAHEAGHCQLGLRAAEGRQAGIVERFRQVTAAVTSQERWMADHPTEVEWMADLSRRVTSRQQDLALAAERNPSPHLLRVLGPPARYGADRELWLASAGALDAYREQWRVEPDDLGRETNLRGAQALAWERARAELGPDPAQTEYQPPRRSLTTPERGMGINF